MYQYISSINTSKLEHQIVCTMCSSSIPGSSPNGVKWYSMRIDQLLHAEGLPEPSVVPMYYPSGSGVFRGPWPFGQKKFYIEKIGKLGLPPNPFV